MVLASVPGNRIRRRDHFRKRVSVGQKLFRAVHFGGIRFDDLLLRAVPTRGVPVGVATSVRVVSFGGVSTFRRFS